ncbi:hypothetical protein SAMN04487917_10835 [Arthrobacter sp. yr096]|uniref:hypothetical protein n=1 Tax=Arthrobacter sp. yr096 TaxID=1761750 RepID=UPI0008D2B30C|nr:hypothetical protein [Arthrobacter sp. yr096]SEJ61407.1 hypothetical protein SAMN04487917_10835 [Arthrobacter sp. yr096]
MTFNELTTKIQIQHTQELSAFRHNITSAPYKAGTPTQLNADRRSVRMGPVQSVEDGNANLTIVADVEGLAWFTADKGLLGSCITVSIAGHRRNTGTRVHLPLAECDAWIEAILGGSWITHVYRAGNKVAADGRLDIASYRLFLDERRNPVSKPQAVADSTLRSLAES